MFETTIFLKQSTLSDLFTIIYVLVDDYLLASAAAGSFTLPQQDDQKGSYAELMSIALVGELLKQPYAGNWYEFVKVEYASLFPMLPDRTHYYRILNKLERIFADFALRFPPQAVSAQATYIVDSKALPIYLDC